MNNPHPKPFHTSGYAAAAYGEKIGSTSAQPFSQRRHIENNRQSVQKYRHSMLAHRSHHRIDIVKPFSNDSMKSHKRLEERSTNRQPSVRTGTQVPPQRAAQFRSPPQRYNPYQ